MCSYILISGLIIAVGFGTWIGCSKDTGVSSEPTPPVRAGKLAVVPSVDFLPQTGVNYDPFKGMSFDDRKAAFGGTEGAARHVRVIARHIAQAMNNDNARTALFGNVPKLHEGEAHLAQLAIQNTDLLASISVGFKNVISDQAIDDKLSAIIKGTDSNGEAILKASTALLDLVVVLVTPEGQAWNPSEKIPIFHISPNMSDGDVLRGIDAGLQPVEFVLNGDKFPYPFLFLNYDEDSPKMRVGTRGRISFAPEPHEDGFWVRWRSMGLIPSAHAHYTAAAPVHGNHDTVVKPAKSIIIYDDHESFLLGSPEIWLYFKLDVVEHGIYYVEDKFDLVELDHVGQWYSFDDKTSHGPGVPWNGYIIKQVKVVELDGPNEDEVATWPDVYFNVDVDVEKRLYEWQSTGNNDARIAMWKSTP